MVTKLTCFILLHSWRVDGFLSHLQVGQPIVSSSLLEPSLPLALGDTAKQPPVAASNASAAASNSTASPVAASNSSALQDSVFGRPINATAFSKYLPDNAGMKSTLAVTFTYFIVYACLSVARTLNLRSSPHSPPSPIERVLENAATFCVYVAPMLGVLFFEVYTRAEMLTDAPPPAWLQWFVVICAGAFCLQSLAYILGEWHTTQLNGMSRPLQQQTVVLVRFYRNLCNFSTMLIYISLLVIMGATFKLYRSKLVLGVGINSAESIANYCTLVLTFTYVAVYLVLFVLRSIHLYDTTSIHIEVMKLASQSINFAPMLCILFLGSQMLVTWGGGVLTTEMEAWMLIMTYSALVQVLIVVIGPFAAGSQLHVSDSAGGVEFVAQHDWLLSSFSLVRCVTMIALYWGVYMVLTPLANAIVNATLFRALYHLGWLFFTTYLGLWILTMLGGLHSRWMQVVNMGRDTVSFCPMLAVLFLSAFMQAREFTNPLGQLGEPQSYSQDCMLVAVAALTIQILLVCVAGYSGKEVFVAKVGLAGFNIATVTLYASVLVVVASTFFISAENATAEGAWFA